MVQYDLASYSNGFAAFALKEIVLGFLKAARLSLWCMKLLFHYPGLCSLDGLLQSFASLCYMFSLLDVFKKIAFVILGEMQSVQKVGVEWTLPFLHLLKRFSEFSQTTNFPGRTIKAWNWTVTLLKPSRSRSSGPVRDRMWIMIKMKLFVPPTWSIVWLILSSFANCSATHFSRTEEEKYCSDNIQKYVFKVSL